MDSASYGLLAFFIILLICSAYFSSTESAFARVNKIRAKTRADEGDKRAKRVMYITSHYNDAITTILIGNNLVNIGGAAIATLLSIRIWGDSEAITPGMLSVLCTIVSTAIVFMCGEMLPKSFANDRPETWAYASSGILYALMKIFRPLVFLFSYVSDATTRLFHAETQPSITEEELLDIIDTAEEEGVMDEEQSDLLKSALEFAETTVKDVMTVRADIFAIDLSLSNDEILRRIKENNYSRVPVYTGRLDNLYGIMSSRRFMIEYSKNPNFDVKKITHRPYHVRESARISDLLTFMRQRKIYLAVVTDEKRHVTGLVTIEDFLEELVGEIWDEDDEYDDAFVKTGGHHFLVDVKLTLGNVLERIGCPFEKRSFYNKPLLAWLFEVFGKMPEEGDAFTYGPLTVTVDSMKDGQIDKLLIYVDAGGKDTLPSLTGEETPVIVTEETASDASSNEEEEAK